MKCKRCYSFAINPHCHGREAGVDLDVCDVCYWRKRAEASVSVDPAAVFRKCPYCGQIPGCDCPPHCPSL